MVLERGISVLDHKPADAWHLQVGRDVCSNIESGLNHEWLVTNGIGGYAAGSIVGATTRSYHGLLVAALHPPVERTVFVSKADEEIALPNGPVIKLGVNEYQEGIVDPRGYNYLEAVSLEGDIPRFLYRLSEQLVLEKRIWMEYGQNTTYVQYTLHGVLEGGSYEALTLSFIPFCLSRDYHSSTQGADDWHFIVEDQHNRCRIRAHAGSPSYQLIAGSSTVFTPTGLWYWHVLHRRDVERGLLDHEDVYQPGIFHSKIAPGMRITYVLTAEEKLSRDFGSTHHEEAVAVAWMRHERRVRQLLAVADRSTDELQLRDPVRARLVIAADQFIVARPDYKHSGADKLPYRPVRLSPNHKTIIAGYPWFTDWGRDSMISLPGLLLCTGRYSEARGLLKAFASFANKGLIPNHFPDSGEDPEYNTVDAMLWMFHTIDYYLKVTADWSLVKELFPILSESIQWYRQGTLYNIGVDASDGLLHAGEAGVQLTWMDAKVDGQVITPRRGKPVEINALWYHALTLIEGWAAHLSYDAAPYSELRMLVKRNFAARFWYQKGGYLYDVVDAECVAGQDDASLRPNQLIAASLGQDLLTEAQIASMLQQVTEHLLTPAGLRSLSPTDPAYHAHFNGDRQQRDAAYHQGTVWQWLIGPYIDVHWRIHHDRVALLAVLRPLVNQLWSTCLGTISEVAEPESPFTPAGCNAQAWSVAELLRGWFLMAD